MRKFVEMAGVFCAALMLAGCGALPGEKAETETEGFSVEQMRQDLLEAAGKLEKSTDFYLEDGMEITGLGVTYDGRPTNFDGCYYWPAIEKLTNVHVAVDWYEAEGYASAVATTLLLDIHEMPDLINPYSFGIMDLADDGLIVPLDDYLELMPEIVAAVGEERMDAWRQADGHIYFIPSVSSVQGSQTMLVRRDWLEALGLEMPRTWEEWMALWKGIRDQDLNGNGDPDDEIPLALSYGSDGEKCMTMLMNAFGIRASADCQFCILDDGTYTMVYEHPNYEEFLQAAAELYREGILQKDFETCDYNRIEELMNDNVLGTTMTWAVAASDAEYLRKQGDSDALWAASPPVKGPHGDQMIQERELVSSSWCITARALEEGKVEKIVQFFNWCFSQEGAFLYNYGIDGISYEKEGEKPQIRPALLENSFSDYRAVGCNFEPFGGLWLEDAFMQCLFSGKTAEELDEITVESYRGLFEVNDEFFYTQPVTLETDAYVRYRSNLITAGVCPLRDRAIRGEITIEEFRDGYEQLKKKGLNAVIAAAEKFSDSGTEDEKGKSES